MTEDTFYARGRAYGDQVAGELEALALAGDRAALALALAVLFRERFPARCAELRQEGANEVQERLFLIAAAEVIDARLDSLQAPESPRVNRKARRAAKAKRPSLH